MLHLQEKAQVSSPAIPEPGAEWVEVGSLHTFGLSDSPRPLPTPGRATLFHNALHHNVGCLS